MLGAYVTTALRVVPFAARSANVSGVISLVAPRVGAIIIIP
jgi:hypothetical protein